MDQFIENFENSSCKRWDVLVLQEFSGARRVSGNFWYTSMGHLVLHQAPGQGRKIGAVVVHARHSTLVNTDKFFSLGRVWGIDILMGGWNIRCVGAHLEANHDIEEYWDDIQDLDEIT